MKTIEQKVRAYDEALKYAQYLINTRCKEGTDGSFHRADLQKMFPELKENEDEKIRKAIICGMNALKNQKKETFAAIPIDDCIAWLEKQGESKNIDSDDLAIENNENINIKGSRVMLNACINVLRAVGHSNLSNWLEEQSKQKPVDKIQLGKKYKCIASPRYSTFILGEIYKPKDKFLCSLMNFCSDCFEPIQDDEQKPADKVGPKFKAGDWVFIEEAEGYKQGPFQIKSVTQYGYTFEERGNVLPLEYENLITPWSIRDAKDGDILSDGITIFIFEDLLSDGSVTSYCDYNISYYFCPLSMNLCGKFSPATKEEQDTLMKAMKEAGYEWDARIKAMTKNE